jgi:hypothetical protein
MGVSGKCHVPAAIYPPERIPSTHWIRRWAGLTAGLYTEARKEWSVPAGDRTLVVRSVVRHYTDCPPSKYMVYII